jgi:NAD(P)-dependent dehydrogenase (short-subunit alcohol dehydrogenase family)
MSGDARAAAGGDVQACGAGVLRGCHAVVTGGSRGIGAAIAHAFAAAGAGRITLLARTREALESVAAPIRGRGAATQVLPCDVTDVAALDAAFAEIGPLDVLVCAAGANVPQPLAQVDLQLADRLWALNVRSALQAAQRAVERMPRSGGAIVLVSSQMGHVGAPKRSVYCATKHALEGLTKALAVELAPRRVRVVSIAPTFVETDMTKPFLADPGFREQVLESIPLGRLATAEEVAQAAVFAAGAGSLTGCSIRVDGGWTAR